MSLKYIKVVGNVSRKVPARLGDKVQRPGPGDERTESGDGNRAASGCQWDRKLYRSRELW